MKSYNPIGIHQWLKNKINYIYFNKIEDSSPHELFQRVDRVLMEARIHYKDISAMPFYVITKTQQGLHQKEFEKLKKGNNTVKSTSINILLSLQAIANKILFIDDKLTQEESLDFIKNECRNFFDKENNNFKYNYFEQQFQYLDDSIINDFKSLDSKALISNYKNILLDDNRSKYKHIEEFGIFYPLNYDRNIFDDKHYFFEINPLKFRTEEHLKKYAYKFLQIDESEDYISTLNNYFTNTHKSHAITYNHHVAYFNPFILLGKEDDDKKEKNGEEFKKFTKYLNSHKKLDTHTVIIKLLNFLNKVTFFCTLAQYESIINKVIFSEYEYKKTKRKDLVKQIFEIEIQRNKKYCMSNEFTSIKNSYSLRRLLILSCLQTYYQETKVSKNKQPTYIDLKLVDDIDIEIFNTLMKELDLFLNRGKSLKLLYKQACYLKNKFFQEFSIPRKNVRFLDDVIKDIITFGSRTDMKKPYNAYLEKQHSNIRYENIKDYYNFDIKLDF